MNVGRLFEISLFNVVKSVIVADKIISKNNLVISNKIAFCIYALKN